MLPQPYLISNSLKCIQDPFDTRFTDAPQLLQTMQQVCQNSELQSGAYKGTVHERICSGIYSDHEPYFEVRPKEVNEWISKILVPVVIWVCAFACKVLIDKLQGFM